MMKQILFVAPMYGTATVRVARDFGKKVNCHARAASAVKRAVRCGVDAS